tara:strand:- start:243 stop:455 length:213 start_codon:yes stop_codon:yes gene_type:complete
MGIIKRRKMDYKIIISLWLIFSASIIYWDMHRWEDKEPISVCHNAPIKIYYDRPMCMECKMYCEVIDENK